MRSLVFIPFLLLTSGILFGQGLQIGVYTEPQFAWITSDDAAVVSNGSVFSLNTGIEFDFFFMPNYAFTIGLNLNNLGGKLMYMDNVAFQQENGTLSVPDGSAMTLRTQYLGTPLGLKLKTEEMGYNTFYVHLGLAPFVNIKAIGKLEDNPEINENIKEEINLLALNYFAELGIEHRLAGNTAIIAGFKWSAGFLDMSSNDLSNNHLTSAGLHLGILF